jgi:hypothetical protein
MARNTGRGSRTAHRGSSLIPTGWFDRLRTQPLVVWAEPDGVALYEGERERATVRRLLTPDEADQLAELLHEAAARVRHG